MSEPLSDAEIDVFERDCGTNFVTADPRFFRVLAQAREANRLRPPPDPRRYRCGCPIAKVLMTENFCPQHQQLVPSEQREAT